MTFYITNKNIDHRYPLLMRHYEYDHYFDKLTGNDTFVINIDTIEALISLDAILRASDEYYTSMQIAGNTITFMNGDVII